EDNVEQRPERVPDQAHIGLERPVEGCRQQQMLRLGVDDDEAEVEQRLDPLGGVDERLDLGMLARGGADLEQRLQQQLQPRLVGDAFESGDEALPDRSAQSEVTDRFEMLAADESVHRALRSFGDGVYL